MKNMKGVKSKRMNDRAIIPSGISGHATVERFNCEKVVVFRPVAFLDTAQKKRYIKFLVYLIMHIFDTTASSLVNSPSCCGCVVQQKLRRFTPFHNQVFQSKLCKYDSFVSRRSLDIFCISVH